MSTVALIHHRLPFSKFVCGICGVKARYQDAASALQAIIANEKCWCCGGIFSAFETLMQSECSHCGLVFEVKTNEQWGRSSNGVPVFCTILCARSRGRKPRKRRVQ